MSNKATELNLRIDPGELDPPEAAELTHQLRSELLDLDVEAVDLKVAGEAPAGTRGGDVVALGELVVTLVVSSGLLTSAVNTMQQWLLRSGSRSIRLELDGDVLEVTGISSSRQDELIGTWVNRHTDR